MTTKETPAESDPFTIPVNEFCRSIEQQEINRLRGLLEDAERDLEEAADDLAIAYADAETYVEHECLPSEDEIANLKRGYEDCMIALKKIRAALAGGGGEG